MNSCFALPICDGQCLPYYNLLIVTREGSGNDASYAIEIECEILVRIDSHSKLTHSVWVLVFTHVD
jgi:hypothetical protein